MSEVNVDWRTIEDKVLRRAWKDRTFAEFYTTGKGRENPPAPVKEWTSVTGRMVVRNPPMRSLPREDGKPTLTELVETLIEKGKI